MMEHTPDHLCLVSELYCWTLVPIIHFSVIWTMKIILTITSKQIEFKFIFFKGPSSNLWCPCFVLLSEFQSHFPILCLNERFSCRDLHAKSNSIQTFYDVPDHCEFMFKSHLLTYFSSILVSVSNKHLLDQCILPLSCFSYSSLSWKITDTMVIQQRM